MTQTPRKQGSKAIFNYRPGSSNSRPGRNGQVVTLLDDTRTGLCVGESVLFPDGSIEYAYLDELTDVPEAPEEYRVVLTFQKVRFYSENLSTIDEAVHLVNAFGSVEVARGPHCHSIEVFQDGEWHLV